MNSAKFLNEDVGHHLTSSEINPIDSLRAFIDLDYQKCVRQAASIANRDKIIICPNFKYVFHAELELNLNGNFREQSERWYLCFTEISLPPGCNYDPSVNEYESEQIFTYPPNHLIIYHNAKTKYRCLRCSKAWTSARGRAIFQTETPRTNKYNFLYIKLCTQQCSLCRQEIQPSWYLNETTRVMKNVCRILIERFYPDRYFSLPRPSSPSLETEDEEEKKCKQRKSRTNSHQHHHQHLCQSCQQGSCYGSHRHCR